MRSEDFAGLHGFLKEFPEAKACLLYLGSRRWHERGIDVVPFEDVVRDLEKWL